MTLWHELLNEKFKSAPLPDYRESSAAVVTRGQRVSLGGGLSAVYVYDEPDNRTRSQRRSKK